MPNQRYLFKRASKFVCKRACIPSPSSQDARLKPAATKPSFRALLVGYRYSRLCIIRWR